MAQHDYNLTNQAGAAFRSDLNDALAAILSSNSGPTAPTTTAAGMWWYDTTNALLKRRNSTDSGWITICAIDSPLSYFSTTQRLVGRNTAGGGVGEEVSLSQLLDWIGSPAQGDILFRGASGWSKLAAGTAGQFLKTQGAGAAPIWDSVADNNGLNLIYGGTVSGTPTVIPLRNLFNDTGYYDIVVIIDTLAYLSGTPTLQMRVSVDGSTDDTSSSYGMVFTTKDHSGVSVDYNNTGASLFNLNDPSYNMDSYGWTGTLYFHNPMWGSNVRYIDMHGLYHATSTNRYTHVDGLLVHQNANTIKGISLFWSTGSVFVAGTGTYRVYGRRKYGF